MVYMMNTTYRVPNNLLTFDTNAKTVKGQSLGFMTGILYMAPHTISGVNLCPMAAIAECDKACLYTAGRGAFSTIQNARLNKAIFFNQNPVEFMKLVALDIHRLLVKARKAVLIPLVRLNGTTDIRWELIPVEVDAKLAKKLGVAPGQYMNIMALFPEVQFYDYTKLANRRGIPANYDLTFSYSGVLRFAPFVLKAMAAGMRIAVVFRKQSEIPADFMGMEVVDGDNSDIRHLDPQGVVVALYAKGKARKDTTGFVVDAAKKIIPIALAA